MRPATHCSATDDTSGIEISDVRYARSGDVSITYQVDGDGPVDLVFVRGITGGLLSTRGSGPRSRDTSWGLAENGRLLMLDKRGTGLSDRVADLPTLETRMDDVRAFMTRSARRTPSCGAGWRGAGHDAVRRLLARAHDRARRPEPLDQGAATGDYPWAPSDAAWRETLLFSSDQRGPAEICTRREAGAELQGSR
jgi:hypothetical protein